MPSTRHDTIWTADAHTLAKIAMLRGYLNAYFSILGRSKRSQDILYVDGFAGPGEYANSSEGSPIAALNAASAAIVNAGGAWITGQLHCIFIEHAADRCGLTSANGSNTSIDPRVRPIVLENTFSDGISELQKAAFLGHSHRASHYLSSLIRLARQACPSKPLQASSARLARRC